MTSCCEKIEDKIAAIDTFGEPISLNYSGSTTYKTCCGGCLTLFLALIIANFAVLKLAYLNSDFNWEVF